MEDDSDLENFYGVCLEIQSPRIYNGNWNGNFISNFDTITITLNGKIDSSLEWEKEKQQAKEVIKAGHSIFWKLNLGLEKKLLSSLPIDSQILALTLSLQHFKEFFWDEFKENTIGLSFYEGDAEFKTLFNGDQSESLKEWSVNRQIQNPLTSDLLTLYHRDMMMEYLILLANHVPHQLPVYLLLDFHSFNQSLYHEISFLNHENLHRFKLALKNSYFSDAYIGWDTSSSNGYISYHEHLVSQKNCQVGVVLPPEKIYSEKDYGEMIEGIYQLKKHQIPFRLILEDQLTAEWDGLNYLMISSTLLSPQGKRKVLGFCAAGGEVIVTGKLLGIPEEVSLENAIQFKILKN